jgi:hypothetical protein
VGTWVGVAYIVTNSTLIDFDFYYVWIHSLNGGSFWLALLVICTMVYVKDVAIAYVQRFHFFSNVHIMQEVLFGGGLVVTVFLICHLFADQCCQRRFQ